MDINRGSAGMRAEELHAGNLNQTTTQNWKVQDKFSTEPIPSGKPCSISLLRSHEAANNPAYGADGFGFHSRARFCASAIWAGVILDATISRLRAACCRSSFAEGGNCEAARLTHM